MGASRFPHSVSPGDEEWVLYGRRARRWYHPTTPINHLLSILVLAGATALAARFTAWIMAAGPPESILLLPLWLVAVFAGIVTSVVLAIALVVFMLAGWRPFDDTLPPGAAAEPADRGSARTGADGSTAWRAAAVPGAYTFLAGLAAATSAAIWLLMVLDEGRSIGAATVQMAAKFTNLTVLLVAVVSAWIALGGPARPARKVAHLTILVMVVVTAVVNATLLDPGLPSGWWGVVDLLQHYLVPVAVVAAWAVLGPRVDIAWSHLGLVLVVPLTWFLFVLLRGEATGAYPYDFVDVAEQGWVPVIGTVAGIVVLMLGLAAAATAIDRHSALRSHTGSRVPTRRS